MSATDRGRRDLCASDIRSPQTLAECDVALALVRDRIASIANDLASRSVSTFSTRESFDGWRARAERAHSAWTSKEKEILYARAVLEANANPELLRLRGRVLSLIGEIHRTSARLAQLAEGVDLPPPLRQFIDARKTQLPEGFYEDYLREWEAGPCG